MTEDFKSDVKIPKTCNECFGSPDSHSPFKLPMPDCWFEKAFHLQESVWFFKDKLNYDLGVDVQRRLLEIKPHAAMENIPPKRRHMTKIGGLNTGKTARRKTERYIREIKEASKRIEERERGTK